LNYRVFPSEVSEHKSSNAGVKTMLAVRGIHGLHQLVMDELLKSLDELGLGLPSVLTNDLTHSLDAD